MLRTVEATRYVTPLREGGSLPAVVEADDLGTYVLNSLLVDVLGIREDAIHGLFDGSQTSVNPKTQLVEEDRLELPRGADVEGTPGEPGAPLEQQGPFTSPRT